MKQIKIFLTLFVSFFAIVLFAQIKEPVKISQSIQKTGDSEYEVVITATMDDNWHIYALEEQEMGIPTSVKFNTSQTEAKPIGKLQIVGKTKVLENLNVFENQVVFKQKFKILKPTTKQISAVVEYQPCDDTQCLAPSKKVLHFAVEGMAPAETAEKIDSVKNPIATKDTLTKPIVENATDTVVSTVGSTAKMDGLKMLSIDKQHPMSDCSTEDTSDESLWTTFVLGFLGGLIAIIMPCVFPLIPLTVSFFTKSKNRKKGLLNAAWFGFFIIFIYVLLSVPFHIFSGLSANIFNQISTNFWLNLVYALIFIIFAISFFGYFEITLPSSWANKADESSNRSGIAGSFFMALTLAIVSFSCTGPILGMLLVKAVSAANGATQLSMAMFGFGLALALPFTLFALFPSLLKSLPKSGGWMTTLKVVIGFIELALAMKFLSKADLVGVNGPLEILKKEPFLVIWLVIFGFLLLYLFKIIRFPHDNPSDKKISWKRWVLAGITVAFMGYLAMGLPKDANLKLLSGLIPPSNYSIFNEKEIETTTKSEVKQGITIHINDLEGAMKIAQQQNKPVLIDFTGYGCENCRRMEDNVWVDSQINGMLKDEVVIVSLYVDSSEKLPASEQKEVAVPVSGGKMENRILETEGDKWASFQAINFENNAQPNYALITPDGKLLNADIAGYKSVEEFKAFLECGIETYKRK